MCKKTKVEECFRKDPGAYYMNENGYVRCHSVHYGDRIRLDKAKEEAQKKPVSLEKVSGLVNELFASIGVEPVEHPQMEPCKIDYAQIKQKYHLEDNRDLVWIKVTKDGFLGVVAQSNDINFDIPPSAEAYDEPGRDSRWRYNTSGIIVHSLDKEWNEEKVLVFPLRMKERTYDRLEIETAVGNYLIQNGVPILDYYSHNY